MSWPTHILEILMYYNGGYHIIRERMRTRQVISNNTLKVTLSRMKKAGLVSNTSNHWNITAKGRKYLAVMRTKQRREPEEKERLPTHTKKQLLQKSKTMIVIFDIPETKKRARAWLRIELSNLGFMMLQKSVWFGPAPLPKKFIESIENINILRYLKFFKATEADVI